MSAIAKVDANHKLEFMSIFVHFAILECFINLQKLVEIIHVNYCSHNAGKLIGQIEIILFLNGVH